MFSLNILHLYINRKKRLKGKENTLKTILKRFWKSVLRKSSTIMLFEFYAFMILKNKMAAIWPTWRSQGVPCASQPTQQTCAHCVTIQTLPPLSCGRAYDKTNTGCLACDCVFCVLTQAEWYTSACIRYWDHRGRERFQPNQSLLCW